MLLTQNEDPEPLRKPSHVSVSGGYWTGSSAVVDLLSEHAQCRVVPDEFTLFSFGQFFQEVYCPLISGQFNKEILNQNLFRLIEFNRSDIYPVRSIIRRLLRYAGFYPRMFFSRRNSMNKRLGGEYQDACNELISILKKVQTTDEFPDASVLQGVINRILDKAVEGASGNAGECSEDIKIGVFDQIIAPPYSEFARSALPDLKCINVDRDWRDQYISMRNVYWRMMMVNKCLGVRPWHEDLDEVDRMPTRYFVRLRENIEKIKAAQIEERRKDILWIHFEDVVLDRETAAIKIFEFLDVDPASWAPGNMFHPEISKKRIGKWKYDKWKEHPLKDEIEFLTGKLGLPDENRREIY